MLLDESLVLGFSVQSTDIFSAQCLIEEYQLINLHTSMIAKAISVVNSHGNSSISHKRMTCRLHGVTCHFCSITEHTDSLAIVGSNIIQHSMEPTRWDVVSCMEISVW